jgi:hypothetical protein
MVLTVMQAAPRVPRKAPDTRAGSSQSVKKDSGDKQAPAAPLAVPNAVSPRKDEHAGETRPNTNESNSVVIRELAPVSVTRDWMDDVSLLFTAILMVAGGLGVLAAFRTLSVIAKQTNAMERSVRYIQDQAITMKRQTFILRDSVRIAAASAQAAKDNADALINSERARLVAELVPMAAKYGNLWHRLEPYGAVSMSPEGVHAGKHLSYQLKVTNIGRTPAEVFAYQIHWGALTEGKPFSPDTLSNQCQQGVHEFFGQGESRVLHLFNVMEDFQGVLRGGEKGAVCTTITYGDTVSAQGQREHTTFVLYHCPNATSPLERINSQTKYT